MVHASRRNDLDFNNQDATKQLAILTIYVSVDPSRDLIDLTVLCVYGVGLKVPERVRRRRKAHGKENFQNPYSKIRMYE